MDRGAWWPTVHGLTKVKTHARAHTHTHTHTHMLLEFMCAYQGFCFPYCGKEHIIQDFFFFLIYSGYSTVGLLRPLFMCQEPK